MIQFILGAIAAVGLSELSKRNKPKMADGGEFSHAKIGNFDKEGWEILGTEPKFDEEGWEILGTEPKFDKDGWEILGTEPKFDKDGWEIVENKYAKGGKIYYYNRKGKYANGGEVGFSEYSNDALADMIVNLSRYESNEDEIETIKAELSKRAASEFFSKLFQSRDIAHKEHLQTDSFAAHKALNEYYDGILPLVDGLVESYQGKYAKIEIADWNTDSKQPIIPYFESLLSYIDKNKDKAFTDSSLLNQVDEIKAMVQGTLYKLKELN